MRRLVPIGAFLAACVLLITFFHEEPSGNGRSRLLTVWGLVENHSFVGDRWHTLTYDKSYVNGHYYSDKAPFSSYLVLPFYAVYRLIEGGPQTPRDIETSNHLAIVVAAAIPFAVYALLIWLRLLRRTALSPSRATWYALLAAFGTSVFNYGNSYFGHVLAGALFLLSYVLAIERERYFVLAGALGGFAVLTEYPVFILVAGVLLLLLLDAETRKRRLLLYCAGALPAAFLFFFHNKMITGHIWQVPYARVVDTWKPMQEQYGMRLPNPWAMWNTSFTPYRGVFFYGPLLILLFPLLWLRFDGPRRRRLIVFGLCVAYFIFNSAYYRWDGGWCTGPRHLTPAIMLCAYEGAAALARVESPRWHRAFLVLAAAGVAVNVASAATNPLPSTTLAAPLFQAVLPDWFHNHLNAHNLLTEWAGLKPAWYSPIVWSLMFAAAAVGLSKIAERAK